MAALPSRLDHYVKGLEERIEEIVGEPSCCDVLLWLRHVRVEMPVPDFLIFLIRRVLKEKRFYAEHFCHTMDQTTNSFMLLAVPLFITRLFNYDASCSRRDDPIRLTQRLHTTRVGLIFPARRIPARAGRIARASTARCILTGITPGRGAWLAGWRQSRAGRRLVHCLVGWLVGWLVVGGCRWWVSEQ